MVTSWSLRLLTAMTGILLLASTADGQQLGGPIITPSQTELTLQAGQNFTLSCRGKRPIDIKHQDIPEDVTGPFKTELTDLVAVNDSEYEVELTLYNVDRFAVGYYACFDSTVNSTEVLTNVIDEPNNTAHISYIYIYVNDSSMFAPMRAVVVATSNSKFIIECRPTTPDIKVKLTLSQSNKIPDSVKFSPKIGYIFSRAPKRIEHKCEVRRGNETSSMHIRNLLTPPPVPKVIGGPRYFLQGDTFSVNCTINTIKNSPGYLTWTIPGEFSKVTNSSNEYERRDDQILFNNYVIKNANSDDAGNYVCMSKNSYGTESATFVKEFLAQPVINMTKSNPASPLVTDMKVMILKVNIDEYPPTNITVFRDNNFPVGTKANVTVTHDYDKCTALCKIIIRPVAIEDTGNYTVVATNQHISKSVTFDFRVEAPPIVDFVLRSDGRYLVGSKVTFICEVVGYTLPVVDWIFSNANGEQVVNKKNQHDTVASIYRVISRLTIPVRNSGNLTCLASNSKGLNSIEREIIVYEMSHGLGIKDHEPWFSEGDNVILECAASKHDFVNVTWYRPDFEDDTGREDVLENVNFSKNFLSLIAKLEMDQIALEEAGTYVCVALRINGSSEREYTSFSVAELKIPQIDDFEDKNEEVDIFLPTNITCTADAVPPPEISWYKDGEPLFNYSEDKNKVTIETFKVDYSESNTSMVDYSTRYSVVKIERMEERNVGKYECRVSSGSETKSKFYNLQIKEKPTHKTTYLSVIGVIFFMLIILVVYLAWKIRKEKQFRKELAAAGLLNFKEGVTKSINPDLGIDEQAELLPYDEKFEFPVEKLILGKQLGAGAFGVVYKADARGITNAEETKTVAVKMVKKTADNMYIKALASELKIMVHLGKHINIVNLLGACTKNVGKRELIVIVEYCKYGNIHNYMQKHREVFIDQLTDNSEKNLGKINRAYSCSSGNSGMHSDYFGSNHTQETDHTFVNTANTNRSTRKVSETGYVQPEWRSNYESDYSFEGRAPRPLCSRDLLAWAFQIARGMEYLASRKVLHGDLAARNVLLADDNIVKICDFGLARSIYKNDEYQKKENSPLPVKWLAIECMTDRIFSTQSDVWSFGIVLWELFSLAKTPYPNVSPHALLDFLSQGRRLDKPAYSDDKLYDVMMRCWDQKPTARPTFSQLQQILGSFLEDNVRNHYVDLNASYMDMNIRREGEDYLAMVNAPDYNNMVTPSPHHYVNEVSNFFPPTPTQLQHDDEGYLQMSPATKQAILNARAQNSKFDFDSRKLAPRAGEPNSYGSELTPMLTLNNLPRNGSESDHEGNTSPYLNMCPRIEEETDEVFETKHNNAKNMLPSAVTNPTYITFSADDEKKPSNFSNNYINVSVPNGLVK